MQVHPRARSLHHVPHTMATSVQMIRRHPKDGLYQTRGAWVLHRRGKTMETYVEQYQAKDGGVTLHTWTDVQGEKGELLHYRGVWLSGGVMVPGGAPHKAPRRYRRLSLYPISFLCLKRFGGQQGKPCDVDDARPGSAGCFPRVIGKKRTPYALPGHHNADAAPGA